MGSLRKKKTVLCCAMLMISMAFGLWIASLASASQIGAIRGTNVNVRDKAGTAGKKVISLNMGDTVAVADAKTDSAGKKWYHVFVAKNGQVYEGYVIEDYITVTTYHDDKTPSPTPTPAPAKETPAPQQPAGGDVTVIDVGKTSKTKKINKSGIVLADRVNVRKKAVSGMVTGSVNKGDPVLVRKSKKAGDGKKWYYISYKSDGATKKGWIRSDFVKVQKKGTDTDTADATPQPTPGAAVGTGEPTPTDDELAVSEDAKRYATVKKEGAPVRSEPGGGKLIVRLEKGRKIGYISKQKAANGKKWYYISYAEDGQTQKGWIRHDRVKLGDKIQDGASSNADALPVLSEEEFEAYMTQQGFPDSYKKSLRALHKDYPQWTFRAVQTNLKWEDALAAESKTGLNLVSKLAAASWKSTESTAYDWRKNKWYTFDGGSWMAASNALIAYHMDPRNFLDAEGIFQFESLEYEKYQNENGVKELLKNSFMKGDYTEPDGTTKSYAASFVEIGKQVGVSPYHLAARCYQEQGLGTSASISGKVDGYENIFNYYNIGAYASGKNAPSTQGLIYASAKATKEELNYERPWNTRYKSLLGGGKYVAEKYVRVGQNTLYFQKFNVVNTKNGLYKHQYMANVQAAASEAGKMSRAYTDKNTQLVFYIPVYTKMPKKVCKKPTDNLNPNNYLASVSVEGYEVTPAFDGAVTDYYVTVEKDTDQVVVSAKCVASTSTVTGAGTVALMQGSNDVILQCTSQSGEIKDYTVHITR